MSGIRTVFLGTPDIARYCLNSLIKDKYFEVVGVVTQPDRPAGRKMKRQPSPVKEEAVACQIPVLTPQKVGETLKEIELWKAEVAVVVAFGQILPQAFLNLYPRQVVNIHTSLLPHWRGAAPIQRSVMAGETTTGVSLQVMVKKLDAGDVIGVRKIDVPETMDAVELYDAMKPLAADLLAVELRDYLRGDLVPQAQDGTKATYAHKIEKQEGQIDWNHSAVEIFNQIRGLALGPGVHTIRGGKKLKVYVAKVEKHFKKARPGEVIMVDVDSFVVASGEDALRIKTVQPESRARMSVKDYLRGYPIKQGEKLGE